MRYALPPIDGVGLERTDVAPDGRRGALIGLKLTNPKKNRKRVNVMVDAHSELMTQYPWGFGGIVPNASENAADSGSFANGSLVFRDTGKFTGETGNHSYTAIVGSDRAPVDGDTGPGHYGPFGQGRRCAGDQTPAPMPSECDDGPFGHGTGGRLHYQVDVPGSGSTTIWIAVAGSENSVAEARSELAALTADPAARLAEKKASREALARRSKLTLPGDTQLQDSIEWGKQNLADLTQVAKDVDIRWTNQGKEWTPKGSLSSMRWIGAGFPDYPWLFGVDGEYTAHAAVTLGQFGPIEDHMRALREISDQLSDRSGVVVHEVVADGSVWYGKDSRHTNDDGTVSYDFNTDEIVKFPGAIALIWRWTGDNGFRDEMLDFTWRDLEYVRTKLDSDGDGWPEGNGNVERPGMGEEKLDNTVYYIRGLYDFADMARSAGQTARADAAEARADGLAARFEDAWWIPADQQYADSLDDPGDVKVNQKHWIGVDPMEVELFRDGEFVPGLASFDHGSAALATRENSCYSGERPGNRGLFHTGCGGGPTGAGEFAIFSLNTGIQAVGEGNYGRLGRRAAAALHGRQRGDPVLGARDRRHARRAAGSDAGDHAVRAAPGGTRHVPGHPAEHRPLLDLPVDVHAGLGPLRHRVGGRAPAARRASAARTRLARGGPAGAGRAAERPGREHPPGRRLGRRARLPRGQPLHDHHRHERGADQDVPDRPHAAARLDGRVGRARWHAGRRLREAPDQPWPRGARVRRSGSAPHARRDGRLDATTLPGPANATPVPAARPRGHDLAWRRHEWRTP